MIFYQIDWNCSVETSTFCKTLILIAFFQNPLQEGYKRERINDSNWK